MIRQSPFEALKRASIMTMMIDHCSMNAAEVYCSWLTLRRLRLGTRWAENRNNRWGNQVTLFPLHSSLKKYLIPLLCHSHDHCHHATPIPFPGFKKRNEMSSCFNSWMATSQPWCNLPKYILEYFPFFLRFRQTVCFFKSALSFQNNSSELVKNDPLKLL